MTYRQLHVPHRLSMVRAKHAATAKMYTAFREPRPRPAWIMDKIWRWDAPTQRQIVNTPRIGRNGQPFTFKVLHAWSAPTGSLPIHFSDSIHDPSCPPAKPRTLSRFSVLSPGRCATWLSLSSIGIIGIAMLVLQSSSAEAPQRVLSPQQGMSTYSMPSEGWSLSGGGTDPASDPLPLVFEVVASVGVIILRTERDDTGRGLSAQFSQR